MNHRHRQFLQHLRDRDWVKATELPESRRTRAALFENGWIEGRCDQRTIYYRITDKGLQEMAKPVYVP